MGRAWVLGMVAVVVCLASHAHAQEPRILLGRLDVYVGTPIIGALNDLGLDYTTVVRSELLRDALRSQEWDLVIVRTNRLFETDPLPELEAHVAAGGALHFQMADLDSAPQRYLDLLGLEGAIDLELPLSDILVPSPAHPLWDNPLGGLFRLSDELFGPDFGDTLLPASGTYAISTFADSGGAAMTIGRDGLVLVNGQEWENWESGSSVARRQIAWLLSCKADLDGDGDLTLFDFLEFQTLFDAGDVRADVFYDGRFDIFDFLAFQNAFDVGCP